MGVALACLIVVFIASYAFIMFYPDGNGLSYCWIPWLAFPLFYMGQFPEKFLITIGCSFGAGILWGALSNFIVAHFLSAAGGTVITFFTCGIMIALICFVHMGFLADTPFGCLSAVFIANLLTTYDSYGAGSVMGELLPPVGYLNLFLILVYGCICVLAVNRVANLFIKLLCGNK